ncbi:NUDIX domain-containing protein [Nocardia rhamnosiphila]|uniref:NUDIX domain-containing protein n=1 Tax=Nocardia rhamnosiphila TaxID=426716 RepID=UPI0037A984B7
MEWGRLHAMKYSAGVLLFRREPEVHVLLGHMGGPLWARKDSGAWSIPKGEYEPETEEARAAAGREFDEELGVPVPVGEWIALGEVHYGSGRSKKQVTVWAVEGELDPARVVPGTFEMEWPPRSGEYRAFPEVDRVEWFDLATAHDKLATGQRPLLTRLADRLR